VGIACAVAASARAEEPPEGPAPESGRTEPPSSLIAQMSDDDLKALYLRCSRAAMRNQLGGGEIALCSMVYERLLRGTFRGDFHALLEWRRGLLRPTEPPRGPF
jgi:hypothetical protein